MAKRHQINPLGFSFTPIYFHGRRSPIDLRFLPGHHTTTATTPHRIEPIGAGSGSIAKQQNSISSCWSCYCFCSDSCFIADSDLLRIGHSLARAVGEACSMTQSQNVLLVRTLELQIKHLKWFFLIKTCVLLCHYFIFWFALKFTKHLHHFHPEPTIQRARLLYTTLARLHALTKTILLPDG